MPQYDYVCHRGHRSTELFNSHRDRPDSIKCPLCLAEAKFRISAPRFVIQGQEAPMDDAREIWAGSGLDGTDGIDEFNYKSDHVQVDYGNHSRPPTVKPRDEFKDMVGIPQD